MVNGVVSEGSNLPGDLASDNLHIPSHLEARYRRPGCPLTMRSCCLRFRINPEKLNLHQEIRLNLIELHTESEASCRCPLSNRRSFPSGGGPLKFDDLF